MRLGLVVLYSSVWTAECQCGRPPTQEIVVVLRSAVNRQSYRNAGTRRFWINNVFLVLCSGSQSWVLEMTERQSDVRLVHRKEQV